MLLEAVDVEAGYGDALVVTGATLEVDAGEMVTVIGPNGAGKSTLLKTIVGLLSVRGGHVTFDGTDITHTPAEEIIYEGICYVPQSDNVFPSLTVEENLTMGAWPLSPGEFEARVGEIYDRFPLLGERTDQRAVTLSGGQQQMLAMGSALMLDPDLLILDEPSAGLAPHLIDDVFEKVVEINESGTAVLMVEQNARRALSISDRGVVLDVGEDRLEGPADTILDDDEVAELYLGSG